MAGPDWSRLGRKGGRRSLAWAAATIAAVGIFLSYLNTSADTAERERASELAAAPTATTSRYLTTSPYLTTGFNGGIGGVAIPTFSTTTLPAGVSSKLWYLLATGDCLRDLPGSTGIEEVIVVSCDTSHAAQVFATDHVGLSLPEILRPALEGESTSTTRSDPGDRCYDAFEAAVGVRPAQTHYEISYLLSSTPTLSGIPGVAPLDPLARNTVVCLLSPNDGSTLSQSALAG